MTGAPPQVRTEPTGTSPARVKSKVLNGRYERGDIEWLVDDALDVQRHKAVAEHGRSGGGHDQYGDTRCTRLGAAHSDWSCAIHDRHHQIRYQHRWQDFADLLERLSPISGRGDVVPLIAKNVGDERQD